jgi:hypothetical protein
MNHVQVEPMNTLGHLDIQGAEAKIANKKKISVKSKICEQTTCRASFATAPCNAYLFL